VVRESLLLPARVWKAVLGPLILVDYTAELHLLKIPVLLVCGGEDSCATAWDQDRLQQSIGWALLVVYEGTGHAVHWEEPQRVAGDGEAFIGNIKTAL
jgi:non-heme chloroperoxidase